MISLSKFAADWPAISALLDEALSLPAAEHAGWLQRLGSEQAVHAEALRALLAHRSQVETDDFLGDMPKLDIDTDEPSADGLSMGSHVGPYQLASELGQGGMGTVWLADRTDGMVRRRVALKLPRIVWGDAFAERLAREREILATLDHEHIARLYDAGVDVHGRPFLAMEYVEGEPIDTFCRGQALGVRDRITLLQQVMAAVAHAHARLVVHRDLKPSNILVTKHRQVKLLDFGIAKLLEGDRTRESILTELGGRALTLDYASPEQIRGEPLGTASDIYSMAVVAYELLAGARPYRLKRASAAELEEAIAIVEPPLASSSVTDSHLARQLRGDLDSILNKALKKASGDRYSSMEAFAQDLQRYLDGEPVLARPDRLAYRAIKFVRRHRVRVAAGAVAVISLFVGTSLALWQAHEARLAAGTSKAVQGFIESVFNANSRYQSDPKVAAATTARELLDRGAERIDKELAAQPEAQQRLYDILAQMYAGMSVKERALALYRRSLELATRLHGPQSDAALIAAVGVASMLDDLDQRKEALETLLKADELASNRRVDRDVVRMNIDSVLAHAYYGSDIDKGLARARRAGTIARELGPSTDGINTLTILGVFANESGHPEEARRALVDAVGWVDLLDVGGVLPSILSSLAEAQDQLGQIEPASASLARALALAERVGDPQNVIAARFRLARFQYQNRLLRQAVETAGSEADRVRPIADDPAVFDLPGNMMIMHGRTLVAYGDAGRGLAVLDEARTHVRQVPNRLAPLLAARADALVALHRLPEAGAELDRAVALMPGTSVGIVKGIQAVRRRYWVAIGKAEDALHDLAAHPLEPGETNTTVKRVWRQTEEAMLLLAAGHDSAAQKAALTVLTTVEQLPERRYLGEAEALMTAVQGEALLHEGRVGDSVPVLEKALELHLATYDPVHSPAIKAVRVALEEAKRRVAH